MSPARTRPSCGSSSASVHRAVRLALRDVDRHRVGDEPLEADLVERVAARDLVRRRVDVRADVVEHAVRRHRVAVVLDVARSARTPAPAARETPACRWRTRGSGRPPARCGVSYPGGRYGFLGCLRRASRRARPGPARAPAPAGPADRATPRRPRPRPTRRRRGRRPPYGPRRASPSAPPRGRPPPGAMAAVSA